MSERLCGSGSGEATGPDDVARLDRRTQTVQVSAAKMHVLALSPIKDRLGEKWQRLSDLVHKLFESAIARVQGPGDSFIRLDELSYAAIFRGLTLPQTEMVCLAVAREVCQALFGDTVEEVAVRSVVADLELAEPVDMQVAGRIICDLVEERGRETVVVRNAAHDPPETTSHAQLDRDKSPLARMRAAQDFFAAHGMEMGMFPIWDLRRGICNSLFMTYFRRGMNEFRTIGGAANGRLEGDAQREGELVLLDAASAYSRRLAEAQQICAISIAVTYDTMSCFNTRIRYLTALQKIEVPASAPLMLRLAQIPTGTPVQRVGELASMLQHLQHKTARMSLKFQRLEDIPAFNFRISAVGVGAPMPRNLPPDLADRMLKRAAETAIMDRMFLYLECIDTPEELAMAMESGARFGVGAAFGQMRLSGLEAVPSFPFKRG